MEAGTGDVDEPLVAADRPTEALGQGMDQLRPENVQQIASRCRDWLRTEGAALKSLLREGLQVSCDGPRTLDLRHRLSRPGLVVALQVQATGVLLLIPQNSLSAAVRERLAGGGRSELQPIAERIAGELLPDESESSQAAAFWAEDLAASLERSDPLDCAQVMELT
ncbi:MAG TPA: hypothetical protein EYP14_06320, partial [Planctomycetaceae bacterium]|nr:hypothetical protein [Planctomycetaceae bacterium]